MVHEGDRVTIREDLVQDEHYGANDVCGSMLKYCGHEAKVVYVGKKEETLGQFRLSIDECKYWWTEEMLKSAAYTDAPRSGKSQVQIKIGMIVRIRDDLTLGRYGTNSVIRSMLTYRGKSATIEGVVCTSSDTTEFYIDLDGELCRWTKEMFDPVMLITPDTFYADILHEQED